VKTGVMCNGFLKEIVLYFLIVLLIPMKIHGISFPDKCELSGVVKDSISGEGLPFASVQVLIRSDSGVVKGTMTDANGDYVIKDIQSEEYIIIASYMGYSEKRKTLNIRSKKVRCDFLLIQKSISLSEITITAEKDLVEKNIEKTTVNVSKNTTVSGGTAIDIMQTLPSVDIDLNGNINYRGSDKVMILINGERSEIAKSLDQLPADQIEKVELINNPSARYEADGMSGIINIVLKSGKVGKNKTALMIQAGYPETVGANAGYSDMTGKNHFFINTGIKHNTKYQIKEHLRENYENPNAFNYYQYDRQDEILNDVFLNTNYDYSVSKNHKIGISLMGSKKFNNADRTINYETLTETGQKADELLKEIDIDLNNYTIDGNLNYRYNLKKGRIFTSKIHYSLFDQLQEMNNELYSEASINNPELQNTYSKQINKISDFSLDYNHPINDSIQFETGYNFSARNLLNDFSSESISNSGIWIDDTLLSNKFNYIQMIHAVYLDLATKFKYVELQAGLRSEFTSNNQNDTISEEYIDLFPSINLSRKLNNHSTFYAGYNRRINRPTIKMLNPFSDEYADLLNMHKGNPDLKPEYVNSVEVGNNFDFNKFSGFGSLYYRHIDQAISRIKSATNDSALVVSFMNLDIAELIGAEISLTYKPVEWWHINSSSNIFHTSLSGEYGNNQIYNSKTGWNLSISNIFKLFKSFGFQLSGYYRSKLPSVMGTYKERYYVNMALDKNVFKDRAKFIFRISDVFNTYIFGLDLDAIDDNGYRYSQMNRRKIETRYFVLTFIYNINGKGQEEKKQKQNFFLDDFDK
jgi:outer membrane receptor protein involved in Fe transport